MTSPSSAPIPNAKRQANVGFALQILQRRLASSPAAIYKSLERRRKRLEERLREELVMRKSGSTQLSGARDLKAYDPDDLDEAPGDEAEEAEDVVANTPASLNVHLNDLLGGRVGVDNLGQGTVDATENWWGSPGGPGTDRATTVGGTGVTFTPWLPYPRFP